MENIVTRASDMNTKFLFLIRLPKELNLQKFETQFVDEFKKYGMDVYGFKNYIKPTLRHKMDKYFIIYPL